MLILKINSPCLLHRMTRSHFAHESKRWLILTDKIVAVNVFLKCSKCLPSTLKPYVYYFLMLTRAASPTAWCYPCYWQRLFERRVSRQLCSTLYKRILMSFIILTFICPCIASISLKYNQKDATFSRSIYFYKLLYMFQAVPPPIIRSTKLYIQRQILSKQYCCLLL
jgi:hypothetical protein